MKLPLRLLVLAATATSVPAQSLYNRNLVVNGDAEAGAPAPNTSTKATIPGWTTYGPLTVIQYDSSKGISPTDYGPVDRGRNYFVGGGPSGSVRSYAEQVIRLEGAEAGTKFYFWGFLGRTGGARDPKVTSLSVSFLNDKGDEVQKVTLSGPDYGGDVVPLALRFATGFLTTGIKQAKITLDLATTAANEENGYAADNISLVLTQEPWLNTNLIVNGDAEVPERELPGWTGKRPDNGKPVPGWNSQAWFFLTDTYARWQSPTDPGPSPEARGGYLLAIDCPRRAFAAFQTIDLSAPSSRLDPAAFPKSKLNELIDSGKVTYALRGWLGHYDTVANPISLRISFYDGVKADPMVSPGQIGPVLPSDHGNRSGMAERSTTGSVPAGARRIVIELLATLSPTDLLSQLYAVADNLSLVLSAPDTGLKVLSISNSASGVAGTSVAPGEMVTLAVSGMEMTGWSGMQLLDRNGPVATSLNGVSVTFADTPAPLLFVSARQIGVVVPFEVYGKDKAPVVVSYKGDKSPAFEVDVVPAVPGVFTQEEPGSGSTAALVWNSDLRLNSSANPAAKGSVVIIFWTGGGQTDPGGATGKIELGSLPRPILPVSVTIGGEPAVVQYAGAVYGAWAGLLMAQVQVPEAVSASGAVPVVITVTDPASGEFSSPAGVATISVQ